MICLQPSTKMFIDGEFVESKATSFIDLHNPVSSRNNNLHLFIIYSVPHIRYNERCTLYSVQWTLYNGRCTMDAVQWTLYNERCTMNAVQWTLYNVRCTMNAVQWTLYNGLHMSKHTLVCFPTDYIFVYRNVSRIYRLVPRRMYIEENIVDFDYMSIVDARFTYFIYTLDVNDVRM